MKSHIKMLRLGSFQILLFWKIQRVDKQYRRAMKNCRKLTKLTNKMVMNNTKGV